MIEVLKKNSHTYYSEIDGLRAISVLSILLFHFGVEELSGGYVGVDIFFVISGFLITKNIFAELERGEFTFRSFYHRRIRRLLPAFMVTVGVTLLVAVFLMSPSHLERTAKAAFYAVFSAANIFFWTEAGYFDVSSSLKPLLHFWSLGVEEQFYFFWPALLVFIITVLKGRYYLLILMALFVVSLAASELLLDRFASASFYLVPFRMFEFILGAACINLKKISLAESYRIFLSAIGLLIVVWSVFAFDEYDRFPGLAALIPCMGAALLLSFADVGPVASLLRHSAMRFYGVLSYSLYLVHWPLVTLYLYWTGGALSSWETAMLIVVATILAYLLHVGVEQRYRVSRHNFSSLTAVKFFQGLLVGTVIILVFSVTIIRTDGLEARVQTQQFSDRIDDSELGVCRDSKRPSTHESLCTLGASGTDSKKLLLVGDSHAGHLNIAMDYIGGISDVEVILWTHSGCPLLWDTNKVYGLENSDKQSSCEQQVLKWESAVLSGEYDYVGIAARWMRMLEHEPYGHANIRRDFIVDRMEPISTIEESRRLFVERLNLTVKKIIDSGAKAIVFSQVPLLARNIQDCNSVPEFVYSDEKIESRCRAGVTYKETMDRLQFVNSVISNTNASNVLAINLSEYFCQGAEQECITIFDNIVLYSDDNHLSADGSFFIATSIQRKLQEFMNYDGVDSSGTSKN